MTSIEQKIKSQSSKYFVQEDWRIFKKMSDYYLKIAVFLKMKNMDIDSSLKLLARNVQKRLFIGIGVELLLKSFFLRQGYCINLVKDKNKMKDFPFSLTKIERDDFNKDKTFTFNCLLQNLHKVETFSESSKILKGFKIAKVFRNKETHLVVADHDFDRSNYTDIENALVEFYRRGFSETLKIKFSLTPNEPGIWSCRSS